MTSTAPKGIVIVGPPRSGTTLLRRLIDAHPDIACPPETYLFGACARFLHSDSFATGLQIGVESGLSFAGAPEGQILERLRNLAFGLLDEYAQRQGKTRWAEKTAFDAFHLDGIERLCRGHVHFVCVQRHGLDVVCSMAELVEKTGGWVDELHPYMQRHAQPLEALAHAWVDAATAVHELAQSAPHVHSLKYEDLTSDPHASLAPMFAEVGADWQPELVEAAMQGSGGLGFGDWKTYGRATIDGSSVGRYKKLPPPVLEMLADICNPTLSRLGYATVDRDAPEAVDARRRYELGLMVNRMKAQKSQTESP